MPAWGAEVVRAEVFETQLESLASEYPSIRDQIAEVEDILRLGYHKGQDIPIPGLTNTYAILVDYQPAGAQGLNLFQVVYHATPEGPFNPVKPFKKYTLVGISLAQ